MQGVSRITRQRLAKSFAFALALLSLIFLLQVIPHGHANGHDEAACGLCQIAHVSVTPAVSGIILHVPLVPVGEASTPVFRSSLESFFHHSDPRAPPAEVL